MNLSEHEQLSNIGGGGNSSGVNMDVCSGSLGASYTPECDRSI